jgi:hypothetical protein
MGAGGRERGRVCVALLWGEPGVEEGRTGAGVHARLNEGPHLRLRDNKGPQAVVADGARHRQHAHHAHAVPKQDLPASRLHPSLHPACAPCRGCWLGSWPAQSPGWGQTDPASSPRCEVAGAPACHARLAGGPLLPLQHNAEDCFPASACFPATAAHTSCPNAAPWPATQKPTSGCTRHSKIARPLHSCHATPCLQHLDALPIFPSPLLAAAARPTAPTWKQHAATPAHRLVLPRRFVVVRERHRHAVAAEHSARVACSARQHAVRLQGALACKGHLQGPWVTGTAHLSQYHKFEVQVYNHL